MNDINKDNITEPEAESDVASAEASVPNADTTLIVGIRYKENGKIYYFDPEGGVFARGDQVVVDTSRGVEFGTIAKENTYVPSSELTPPLRKVLRAATDEDIAHHNKIEEKKKEAFSICLEKINEHNPEMKLIDLEYTFDNTKLMIYFTADRRVDFRELVKDLAAIFKMRIELRQIRARDSARFMGGLGNCGRPFCCSTFLSNFVQISVKMAKEQNISLNPAKISGTCGLLMCCLQFEHQTYEEEIRKTPPVDTKVKTPDGIGTIIETSPLSGNLKVMLPDRKIQTIHRDKVAIIEE